jgi:hypothetical protein
MVQTPSSLLDHESGSSAKKAAMPRDPLYRSATRADQLIHHPASRMGSRIPQVEVALPNYELLSS